jgi:hypothetical protein
MELTQNKKEMLLAKIRELMRNHNLSISQADAALRTHQDYLVAAHIEKAEAILIANTLIQLGCSLEAIRNVLPSYSAHEAIEAVHTE